MLVVLLLLGGCNGEGATTPATSNVQSLEISPSDPSLASGTSMQLTATAIYFNGTRADVTTQVEWTSSATATATVGATSGQITGVSPGIVYFSADLRGQTASTRSTVSAATLVSIAITPPSPSLAAGTAQTFTATGTFTDHTTQNLATDVSWTSSNPAIATLDSSGRATGISPGTVRITATCTLATACRAMAATATMTVTGGTLVSIAISVPTPTITVGATAQFTATGTYTDHSTHDLTDQATWASDAATVATISNASGSQGIVSALAIGTAHITAAFDSITSGSVTITVAGPHAYISDAQNGLYVCAVNAASAALTNCRLTGGGFTGSRSVAFFSGDSANYAYVANGGASIYVCVVNSDGTLSSSCSNQTNQSSYFNDPVHATVLGSTLYVANSRNIGGNVMTACTISGTDGSLSSCTDTASGSGLNTASGLVLDGTFGYVETADNAVFICSFAAPSLTGCTAVAPTGGGPGLNYVWTAAIVDDVGYFASETSGLTTCTIGNAGEVSGCSNYAVGSGSQQSIGVARYGANAYVSTQADILSGASAGAVYLCPVSGLVVSTCSNAVTDGSDASFGQELTDVIIH